MKFILSWLELAKLSKKKELAIMQQYHFMNWM